MVKKLAAILLLALLPSTVSAADWHWNIAAGSYLAANSYDVYTTQRGLEDPYIHETNPLLPEHPSDARLMAQSAAVSVLILWGAHGLRERGHRKLSLGLLWGAAAVHLAAGIHNRNL